MKHTALFVMLLLSATAYAQQPNIEKKKFHWGRNQDTTAGYAQGLLVDNVLYISGTVARDVTPEGVRSVYTNLERTLKHDFPAATWVQISRLYMPDAKLEIELIAHLPKK